MDNTLLISFSAQNALTRRLEVAANNMANVSTAGFKAEQVLFEPVMRRPASIVERPTTVEFVRDYTIARDFRPGTLQRSDNPLDVALTGQGFFTIATPNGPAYTRDGQFTLDTNGRMINHEGKAVLDANGAEITLDLIKGAPLIGKDGTITQSGTEVAKIGIVNFEKPGALKKVGDNLWRAEGQNPIASTTFEVVQGMVEGSNVVAINELTNIMQISRAFESATRLARQAEDLRSKAIERLARI